VARVSVDERPAPGDEVRAGFARERAHLFDDETGERRPWD
jgi:hypothetical protein